MMKYDELDLGYRNRDPVRRRSIRHDEDHDIVETSRLSCINNGPPEDIDLASKHFVELDIDEAIERLGMGHFQHKVLLATGLCFTADSTEILLLSFLSIVLRSEWGLSDGQTGSITTCVFMGALVGTMVLGMLGDRIGRKPVFFLTATIISVFGLATAATTSYTGLLLTRGLVGFGVGGLTVPFDTLAEFLPSSQRGQNLLVIEYFWVIGSVLVTILAYLTLSIGWRFFVVMCAIPCILSSVLGLVFVPESPRWLLAVGREHEALLILRGAALTNGKDPDEIFPLHTRLIDLSAKEEEGSLSDLFTPQWRLITLLLGLSWAGFAISYYGTIMLITLTFSDQDLHHNGEYTGVGYSFDYGAILTSSLAEFAGTTLVILMIDRCGRVRTQAFNYFLGGLFVLLLGLIASDDSIPRKMKISAAFMARLFFMGASCSTWVSTAEILTTDVRTSGHSFANAVARVAGSFSAFLVALPTPTAGVILFLTSLVATISTSLLPETKGKSMGTVNITPVNQDIELMAYSTSCV